MKNVRIERATSGPGRREAGFGKSEAARPARGLRLLVCGAACVVLLAAAGARTIGPEPSKAPAVFSIAGPALYFEANSDQGAGAPQFIARGRACDMLLAPTEAMLVLGRRNPTFSAATPLERIAPGQSESIRTRTVRFRLEGANPRAKMSGREPLPGKVNYFIGNDPSAWRAGLPLFAGVQVDKVYPGVALIYYGNEQQLEYDFRLAPGADPGRIAVRCEGADGVRVDAGGNLVLKIGEAEVRQHRPVIYQVVNGVRRRIAGGYRLTAEATAGFWVGEYDRRLPLVIDPVLSFSTYLGGTKDDRGWAVAADGDGGVYVCGETLSVDLPTTAGALMSRYRKGSQLYGDAFVARYAGTNLSFLTYFGGKRQDGAFAIAVDKTSNAALLTGFTDSPDFPRTPTNVFQTQFGGTNLNALRVHPLDAFVAKFDTNGGLVYSTLIGGNHRDVGMGIAVDALGRAYVTGYTESSNYPTVNALQGLYVRGRRPGTLTNYSGAIYHGNGDAFVARLSADGTALDYYTYLGGTNQDVGEGIALDSADDAYVVGMTSSTNFPTTQPLDRSLNATTNRNIATDGFISVLSDSGSNLWYSTFLGGSGNDAAMAVAVDAAAAAYVTGYTYSTNSNPNTYFPPLTTTNFLMYVSRTNVNADVFVIKFAPVNGAPSNGYSVTNGYSIVFGGRKLDQGLGIAVDPAGDAYVVGFSSSTNIAGTDSAVMTNFFATNTLGGFTATNSSLKKYGANGANDAFVVELDPAGASFLFSAFLGGSWNDQANGISFDPAAQAAYVVGTTLSTDFPQRHPTQPAPGGKKRNDAFVGRIEFPEPP